MTSLTHFEFLQLSHVMYQHPRSAPSLPQWLFSAIKFPLRLRCLQSCWCSGGHKDLVVLPDCGIQWLEPPLLDCLLLLISAYIFLYCLVVYCGFPKVVWSKMASNWITTTIPIKIKQNWESLVLEQQMHKVVALPSHTKSPQNNLALCVFSSA